MRNFVANCAEDCGCGAEAIDQIRLAVDEAFTNIVKHAYSDVEAKDVAIRVEFDDRNFKVVISDQGMQFKPGTIREPNVGERIRQRKRGGVGVFLIHKLMDDVQYLRHGNHNEIVMTKRL